MIIELDEANQDDEELVVHSAHFRPATFAKVRKRGLLKATRPIEELTHREMREICDAWVNAQMALWKRLRAASVTRDQADVARGLKGDEPIPQRIIDGPKIVGEGPIGEDLQD